MKKPFPIPTPDSRPFWNGLAERKILLKRCRQCGHLFHYPRITCPHCLSSDLEWQQSSGRGTLYTYTISRRPTHPLFADEVPQYLAVVELEEGPRVTSTLVNVAEDKIKIGMALTPVFERHEKEKAVLLRFQPADPALQGTQAPEAESKPAAATQVTPDVLAHIGRGSDKVTGYPVSAEEIRRFCYATDDMNPRHLDAGTAPAGIVAPPMFLSIPFDWEVPMGELPADGTPQQNDGLPYPPLKAKRKLFGGYQVEYFQEIRPGDVLTRQRKILDIYERSGGSGSSVFVVIEATYTNQRGEKVAVDINTIINR